MLTEDYCSYEVAKLLKEKGFDIPCKYAWHGGIKYPDFHRHSRNFNGGDYKDLRTKWYSAPTHQMAMKWLRENKGLFINIGQSKCMNAPIKYRFSIWKDVTYIGKSGDTGDYSTYEEAVEAALKYCLTNLI